MGEIKTDWILIELFHDRYFFSQVAKVFKDYTFQEVIDDLDYEGYIFEQIGDKIGDTGYIVDLCEHRPIGDYEYETDRVKGVAHFKVRSIIILDLNKLHQEEELEVLFGQTNTKYGLLDIIKGDF